MWVPWVKKSSVRTHTRSPSSFDDHPPSPIHLHSPSLKDIETLFNHHPPPLLTPLHKHSFSSASFSPAHHSVSFKDVNSLFYDDPARTQSRKPSVFNRVRTWAHQPDPPPDSHNKVVVYYTSLHVVRRTFEDCKTVRSILKGYKVKMDERDLAMDARFVDELQRIIPSSTPGKKASLPTVYFSGKYVGGVEEIRRLQESGELKRMIRGLPLDEGGICKVCGGYRSILATVGDLLRLFYEAPGFRVFKRRRLVIEPGDIAINYLKSTFILDFIAVLPLPQVKWYHILASEDHTDIYTYLNLLFWIQRLPRLFVVVHSKAEITKTAGVLTKSAMSGAFYNLLWFINLSNIYGAEYYHMHIDWLTKCTRIVIDEKHLMPQSLDWDQLISNCTQTNNIEQGIFASGLTNKIGTKNFIQNTCSAFHGNSKA
uniref:Glutaredoxin domain-containing protein n=1 Tax=Chenopodium quinoa TaxID=63459 RepID=A0A803M3Y0_CHEQI